MIFYHRTTLKNWNKIQEEGILFGRLSNPDNKYHPSRCTYLTIDINEAKCYGEIILEVEYNPFLHPKMNNYIDGCWQLRVYEPIEIKFIKNLKEKISAKI